MNLSAVLDPNGPLVGTLAPVVACVVAAVVISALLRVVGRRLLDDPAEADGLARTALVGVSAVGVLLGLGRLVNREATDQGLQASLEGIVLALPGLTIMFILLIAALLVAAIMRATVIRVVATVRPSLARVVGSIVYWTIVIVVALIAAQQAGIDVGILRQLLLLALTGLIAAVALGLGLSLRPILASVVAGRHVEGMVQVGQTIQVGDTRGQVDRVGQVSVRIRREDGAEVDVPHTTFLDQPTTFLDQQTTPGDRSE